MQFLCSFLHAYSGKDFYFFFWQVNAKQNMAWTFQCREVHTGNLAEQPEITQTIVQNVQGFKSKAV